MKRILCLALTLILLCGCAVTAACADEGLTPVHCEEQGFSTMIPAGLSAEWQEGSGLRVSVGTPGYVPYIFVYRRPDRLNSPVNYLNNVYREYMENKYNNNVGTNPCKEVEIGGKTLYMAQYHYTASGNQLCVALLIEPREDGDVQYLAKFVEGKSEATFAALEPVVRCFLPDGAESESEPEPEPAPAAETAALEDIVCNEQGYTTKMPAGLSTTWQEGNGLRVWVDEPGYVPNVLIWRRQTDLDDPETYVKQEYTEYMKSTYGDRLVGVSTYEYYDVGGKRLIAASYIYKGSSGASINQLHLYEVRPDGDVEYNARYLNDEREATLAALDAAVRYYQPIAAQKSTVTAAPAAASKQLNTSAVQPILKGTAKYSDGRFTMTLPKGWQILTDSDYMTFCFKAWDPANPNRTIFMFMKMEPFLKSWKAQQTYKKVNDSLGGNSLYALSAYAPVMETCTLKGLLDAMPQVYSFCERFYDAGLTLTPSVLPAMTNVSIVEKTPSLIPAPATCKENVIARITFEDYLGQPCEGLVTAQPTDSMSYDFYGVDGWPYTVYLFMGVTSPIGELQELEDTLTACLCSFDFEQSYVKKAIGLSNAETQALLQRGREMQAAHDALVSAWYAREQSHDIAIQKWSDSFMGYDRLYDSSTGEVYLADTGFYDSYDLHRYEYNNPNLQIVDNSTQQYYLQGADYYITK